MAEFVNALPQTVEVNANVLFNDTIVEPCPKVRHRSGSGIFTLKGGRYQVFFNGNVAIPTDETVGPITMAISLNGEALQGGIMIVTPAAVEEFFNVAAMVYIDVPCNCCYTLSVRNTGATPITVDDANLITIREAQ